MKLSDCNNREERAQYIEKKLSITLQNIQKVSIDSAGAAHCENRVGSISIPLGVAGPLNLIGENVKGEYYVPLATTEGALVASVNRGMKATFEKGIVSTAQYVGVTRGPVLKAKTIGGALKIEKWINNHRNIW